MSATTSEIADYDVVIRLMKLEDIPTICRLAEKEEWNYSPEIVRALFEASPAGSFVAVDKGRVIGIIMGYNLNEHEAFGGFWIVDKEYRGKGIGTRLWKRRREHTGEKNFGINSMMYRVAPNTKLGFTVQSWKMAYLSGTITRKKLAINDAEDYSYIKIVPSTEVDLTRLAQYDTSIHTIERQKFVQLWVGKEKTLTFVAIHRDSDDIVGYGVIQRSSLGNFIGPIYGESQCIMRLLLLKLIENAPHGDKFDLAVPIENDIAREMLQANEGLKVLYEMTRMYFQRDVKLPLSKILAVASPETVLC